MRDRVLQAIVRQQWTMLVRDRRLMLVGAVLLIASLAALATGTTRNERLRLERESASRADAEAWKRQGEVNPHGAAHFGHYVVKPVAPLSAFDPGLLDHVGTLVRLEAHKQNPAIGRPTDTGTALNRFASFSAASALQVLAPLLVILTAFGAFSGERARVLLQQELASGVRPRVLLLGRLLALSSVVAVMLAVFLGAGIVVLLNAGAGMNDVIQLVLSILGYGLYLLTFLALALGISTLCRSARSALTSLLAYWILAVWVAPAVTPGVASAIHVTPSGSEFQEEVTGAIDEKLDAGGPRERRPQQLKQVILQKYGVRTEDELPVNFAGAMLEYAEDLSTNAYQEYFARLHDAYREQEALARSFSILSPLIALKPWSAALAETDFAAHHRFLMDAERYRYAFVQRLNRDILLNRPRESTGYVADVARLTADLDRFEPSAAPLAEIWRRQWLDLSILAAWFALAVWFAIRSADRLRSQP